MKEVGLVNVKISRDSFPERSEREKKISKVLAKGNQLPSHS